MRGTRLPLALAALLALEACSSDPGIVPSGNAGAGGLGGGGAGGFAGGGTGGTSGTGTGGTGGAMAAGIVVDTASGQLAMDTQDGKCDIIEAAAAAASGQTVRECANPSGNKTILLTAGRTYPTKKTLRLVDGVSIATTAGGAHATVAAAPGWTSVANDPTTACLVHAASSTGTIKIDDVTLSQDASLTLSGLCVTRGFLDLRRARVTGFRASGIVATCRPETGCDHEPPREDGTTLRVLGSLVDSNSTDDRGGGIFSDGVGAVLIVSHSAVVDNTAAAGGGGAYFGGGWATDIIDSSTISGNTASAGGGVQVRFANCTNTYLNIFNSTISDNSANGSGGGIDFRAADMDCSTQDVSVFASIVAGNRSESTTELDINADWNFGLFNCVRGSLIYVAPGQPRPSQDGAPCVFNQRDPRLAPLTPLGGAGDLPVHPLRADSPAIDGAPDDLTADQQRDPWIALADAQRPPDWTLFDRVVDGDGDGVAVRDLGAVERSERWQTELLAVAAKGTGAHAVVTSPDGYDRGAGTSYAAAGATNEFVTYTVPIVEAARHQLSVGVRKDPGAGQFQIAVADAAGGPWTNLGPPQDGYADSPTFAALGPFPTPIFAAPGDKLVKLTVVGKNAASGGHALFLDYIDARKSLAPCAVKQLAVGANHTCALMSSGGVRCWGANERGELGAGAGPDRTTPPAADILTGVDAIAAGALHTCALTTGGAVRCWGWNGNGQLGDGTTTARPTPSATDVLTGVKAIAAGGSHTCALMTGGGVRCWGANMFGQLGDGTMTDRPAPPTSDVLAGVKALAAGGAHTCALTTGGGVRCWGGNVIGQLGDGTKNDRATPPTADVIAGVQAIATGDKHTCAVTTAGGVRCWGHNLNAELGNGTYLEQLSPPTADVLGGAKDVAAGLNFTCALTTAGGVRCWGYNSDGQIGDETETAVDRWTPAQTDVLGGVQALGVGFAHTCALMTAGGVRCWGSDMQGQLGDGLAPQQATIPPTMDAPGLVGTCP